MSHRHRLPRKITGPSQCPKYVNLVARKTFLGDAGDVDRLIIVPKNNCKIPAEEKLGRKFHALNLISKKVELSKRSSSKMHHNLGMKSTKVPIKCMRLYSKQNFSAQDFRKYWLDFLKTLPVTNFCSNRMNNISFKLNGASPNGRKSPIISFTPQIVNQGSQRKVTEITFMSSVRSQIGHEIKCL
ncbi:hypothetical protein MA16_Dca016484 [Dendrobium catenatum]|uniref:Uncharacterized protein n=1 Tax=Dendrobium catenatum TaxID=906689 RepID=A0A2I0VYS2_9ASPA|nr:hypothetical protein MA16_Dca016484 [Dendrobium catenatum]